MTEIIWHYGLLFGVVVALALSVMALLYQVGIEWGRAEAKERIGERAWPKRPRRRM